MYRFQCVQLALTCTFMHAPTWLFDIKFKMNIYLRNRKHVQCFYCVLVEIY